MDAELQDHTNCQHLVVLLAGQVDLSDGSDPQVTERKGWSMDPTISEEPLLALRSPSHEGEHSGSRKQESPVEHIGPDLELGAGTTGGICPGGWLLHWRRCG